MSRSDVMLASTQTYTQVVPGKLISQQYDVCRHIQLIIMLRIAEQVT